MEKTLLIQLRTFNLLQLSEVLNKVYYIELVDLCNNAKKSAAELNELEDHQTTSQYILLCNKIINQVTEMMHIRNDVFIPYYKELHEKNSTNHNCANCSGKCDMQHSMRLVELKESHVAGNDILHQLQMVALPLYSETIYPNAYRILRNQMVLIENTLTELFMVEETYLIPLIVEAQKKIYAVS